MEKLGTAVDRGKTVIVFLGGPGVTGVLRQSWKTRWWFSGLPDDAYSTYLDEPVDRSLLPVHAARHTDSPVGSSTGETQPRRRQTPHRRITTILGPCHRRDCAAFTAGTRTAPTSDREGFFIAARQPIHYAAHHGPHRYSMLQRCPVEDPYRLTVIICSSETLSRNAFVFSSRPMFAAVRLSAEHGQAAAT